MATPRHRPGFKRSLITGLLVLLSSAVVLWAHSEPYRPYRPRPPAQPAPPPSPPPNPPPPVYPEKVYALRWSWLHWWEANRGLYLHSALQGEHLQDINAESLNALRAEASSALVNLLDDDAVAPRMTAAVALGRIGAPAHEGVLDKLKQVADDDTHEEVRLRALLAIGMIGDEQSERILTGYDPANVRLRAAALIATGFLNSPSDSLLENLKLLMGDPSPTIRYAAAWALAQSQGEGADESVVAGVVQDASPWVASLGMRWMGGVDSEDNYRLLRLVTIEDEAVENLPSWRLLENVQRNKLGEINIENYRKWVRAHRQLFSLEPTPPDEVPDYLRRNGSLLAGTGGRWGTTFRQLAGLEMVNGVEAIYMARLRSSAAIALGLAGDQPGVVQALQTLIHERDDDYNVPPKCFALISLGQIGAKEGLVDLLAVASDEADGRIKRQEDLESPQRGFAAIALGLYARPYDTAQGRTDRPGYEHAIRMLQARLSDKREKLEMRTACAVALGLSGRTSNLKLMIGEYDRFYDEHTLLGAYVLLGRGLLGDQNLDKPVRYLISQKPMRDETSNLLARRAAVLALGVSGMDQAIPTLTRFYDEPYFVNREVILALSLCNTEGLSSQVLPRLGGDANQFERAYMAEIVGKMLERERPPSMSRFNTGGNFMMKNGLLMVYQREGNVFLYDYLIPQFEGTWY